MANGRQLLRSRALTVGVLLYLLALAVLWRRPEFSLADTLLELFIFGLGLSLIAWWATIRAKPLAVAVHPGAGEMLGLLAYLVALSVYLAFGPQWIDSWLSQAWIESEQAHFFVNLVKKLVVFVLLPFALFGPLCGYALRDYGWQAAGLRELFRSHLLVVLLLSGVILALQYFLGGGAAPIREGKLTSHQLVVGLPLCFLWLAVEAGLVEEFFFRALLQTRFSAWFKSEVTGISLMALAFGLAHAPGFILNSAILSAGTECYLSIV